MKLRYSIKIIARTACLALACAGTATQAQEPYPNPAKTIKIVVPFPPGGASTDGIARIFAQELAKEMKTNVVVENKPGAGTAIGALAVKSAPADGYTMFFQTDGLYNAKLTNPGLAYEHGDFEIISPMAQTNYVFVVPAARGWSKLDDMKSLKRELDVGTLGIGVSSYSMLAERMANHLGMKHRMIPYKGGVEGVTAVIAGEIDGYFATVGLTHTLKDNPKVTLLASTGSAGRKSSLPNVKTFQELGMPDMVFHSYYGLAIRSDTPDAIKERLTRSVRKVVESEEMKKAREKQNLDDYLGSTEEYKRDVQRVFKMYEAAVNAARNDKK